MCDPNSLIFGKYLLVIFGMISRFINSNLKNWELLGGAPFKISDRNLGLPGLPTMGRTESTNANAWVSSCRLVVVTFDASGVLWQSLRMLCLFPFFSCLWDLVLSECPKTGLNEEVSTIVRDQSIFSFFFANPVATPYEDFPKLQLRSSSLIYAQR